MLNKIFKIISIKIIIILSILCLLILLHFLSRVVPTINFQENTDLIKDLIVIFSSIFIVSAIFETFFFEFNLYKNWKIKDKRNIQWLTIIIIWKIIFITLILIMIYLINKPISTIDQIYYYNDIIVIIFFFSFVFITLISSIIVLCLKYFRNILKIEENKYEIKK